MPTWLEIACFVSSIITAIATIVFLACVGIIIAARIYLNRPLDPEAERAFEMIALEARQRGCKEGRVGRDVE